MTELQKHEETLTRNEPAPTPVRLAPFVDVYQNAEGYLVFADLPGLTRSDIQIRLEEADLTVEATRPGRRYGEAEIPPRHYRRQFRVPEGLDAARIDARYEAGVLRLYLPKAEAQKPRRIEVQ